nr:Tn3 family transposase [Streptomyces fructofermentans]
MTWQRSRCGTPRHRALGASNGLAQAWGGGLASVDGMRSVVPVPSVHSCLNPHYFGRRGGATWLHMPVWAMLLQRAVGRGHFAAQRAPRASRAVVEPSGRLNMCRISPICQVGALDRLRKFSDESDSLILSPPEIRVKPLIKSLPSKGLPQPPSP